MMLIKERVYRSLKLAFFNFPSLEEKVANGRMRLEKELEDEVKEAIAP